MGSAQSRNVIQSTVNIMNKSTNRVALEQVTSVNVVQALNIVNNKGKNIIIRGNEQTITASVDASSYLNAMQSNETKQAIQQEIEQMASALVSGINFGNSTEASNEISTVLKASNEVVNTASMKCQTTLNTSQVINVTENVADDTILIEGQKQAADVAAISKCQLDAVQGNTTMQEAQQKIRQKAISETKGLDPTLFLGMLLAIVVLIIGGIVMGMSKAGSKVAERTISVFTGLFGIVGVGLCAYMLLRGSSKRGSLQFEPPKGTSVEDFFYQYPFLKHTEVHSQCGSKVLIDGEEATRVLGVDTVVGRRNQLLVDWVKRYNSAVEDHKKASGKTPEEYAKLPLASQEERIMPPAADAPKDKRWDVIHAAYIGPGTIVNNAGFRVENPDTSVVKIWAYGFAPSRHYRRWSQWTGSDTDAIYKDRPDMYKRTTTNAVMELVNRGKLLLDALSAVVAKPSQGDYKDQAPQFSAAGSQRNRAKLSAYFAELMNMPKRECGTWIDPYLPAEPPQRVNNDTKAPVAKFAVDTYKFGRDLLAVTDETLNLKQCLPEAIMYQYLLGLYNMDSMLQQETPPTAEVLWQLLTGKRIDEPLTPADVPGRTSGDNGQIAFQEVTTWPNSTDALHTIRPVNVQFTSEFSSRAEPLLHLLARARKDAATGFTEAHELIGENLTNAALPISRKSGWWSAWTSNMTAPATNPFTLSADQRDFLKGWDAEYSKWVNSLRQGFEAYNNGTPVDEQSWKDVTVVTMKYVNAARVPFIGFADPSEDGSAAAWVSDSSFFRGESKAGLDIKGWVYVGMGVCGAVVLGSMVKFVRARDRTTEVPKSKGTPDGDKPTPETALGAVSGLLSKA